MVPKLFFIICGTIFLEITSFVVLGNTNTTQCNLLTKTSLPLVGFQHSNSINYWLALRLDNHYVLEYCCKNKLLLFWPQDYTSKGQSNSRILKQLPCYIITWNRNLKKLCSKNRRRNSKLKFQWSLKILGNQRTYYCCLKGCHTKPLAHVGFVKLSRKLIVDEMIHFNLL